MDTYLTATTSGPDRELARTPPPSDLPPIAGTPFTDQPDKESAPTPITANLLPAPQTEEQSGTSKIALDVLSVVFNLMITPYQTATNKLKQSKEDPSTAIAETPFPVYEQIGRKLITIQHYIEHQQAIEARLDRLEQMLKEIIAINTMKTYATATAASAAPAPEINCIRVIQQQNLERRMHRRKEQAKFELILTIQDMDPDTKAQLHSPTNPRGNHNQTSTNYRKSGGNKLPHNLRNPKA